MCEVLINKTLEKKAPRIRMAQVIKNPIATNSFRFLFFIQRDDIKMPISRWNTVKTCNCLSAFIPECHLIEFLLLKGAQNRVLCTV